jgi:hypothetical protein
MDTMNPTEIARIARTAARRAAPQLDVVGVTIGAGGTAYVEILLEIRGCHTDSCQVVVGVFRDVPEATLESDIAAQLRQHLTAHQPHDAPRE